MHHNHNVNTVDGVYIHMKRINTKRRTHGIHISHIIYLYITTKTFDLIYYGNIYYTI